MEPGALPLDVLINRGALHALADGEAFVRGEEHRPKWNFTKLPGKARW